MNYTHREKRESPGKTCDVMLNQYYDVIDNSSVNNNAVRTQAPTSKQRAYN